MERCCWSSWSIAFLTHPSEARVDRSKLPRFFLAPGPRSIVRRHRTRPAILVDGNIGENALGHGDLLLADAASHPALDLHRDRGSADLDDLRVARHLVADEDRAMKGHGGDRHGRGAPLGAPPCNGAAREIHLRQQPTPKISPYGLASAGMAMARSAGSARGGSLERSQPCIGLPFSIARLEISSPLPRNSITLTRRARGGARRKTRFSPRVPS